MYDAVKLACIVLVDDMLQCCPTLLPNHVAVVFLASIFALAQCQQQRRQPDLGPDGMLLEAQLHCEEIDSSRFTPLLRCQPSPSPDARHEQGHSGHAPHVPTPRLHCTVRQYPHSLSYAMRTVTDASVSLPTITHIIDKEKPIIPPSSLRCCI
jgi:hypothetical protein